MQVTTLNKIVNLFLVGTFANLVVILFISFLFKGAFSYTDYANLKVILDPIGAPTIVIIATVILLSTGIMFGIIVDSIANLIFHRIVELCFETRLTRKYLFFCQKSYDEFRILSTEFKMQFNRVDKYQKLTNRKETVHKSYAAAIFFNTANKENIEWVVQHFSLYLLSINFLLILIISFFPLMISSIYLRNWYLAILVIAFIPSMYALLCAAVHKYLYAYEITFRHSSIVLVEERAKEKDKEISKSTSTTHRRRRLK